MSFSFGFSGEDLSDDEYDTSSKVQEITTTSTPFQDPLLSFEIDAKNMPREIELSTVLQSLVGHRLTFNDIEINGLKLYRREIFDIKHQLMMEEEEDDNLIKREEFQILMGDTHEDLKNQVYEGGLKSWECSIDTVEYLSNSQEKIIGNNIVELGCGTSLPSIYLFIQALRTTPTAEQVTNFILSDFNQSVLRLVTIPNLLINWAKTTLSTDELINLQQSTNLQTPIVDDELEITQSLVNQFIQSLSSIHAINFQFISGSWCHDFLKILTLNHSKPTLIISSETIYSPQILPIISELIIRILKMGNLGKNKAIVSAKDIYFGVGGSINEFIRYLEQRKAQGTDLEFEVLKLNSNLKRSIVIIS